MGNDLMDKLEIAQSYVGRTVVAKIDTWNNGGCYPYMLLKGCEYGVFKAVSSELHGAYLCIRDSQEKCVAVPIGCFEV